MPASEKEELKLSQAVQLLLDEGRMLLPGIQGLFGFQLIAVFNTTFWDKLTADERAVHLAAIGLVTLAIALVIAPAAYHRQRNPEEANEGFIRLATRLLLWAMFPMLLGIGLDFYLITRLILNNNLISVIVALLVLLIYLTLWFALPRWRAFQKFIHTES